MPAGGTVLIVTEDQSILDDTGKVLFYSGDRFLRDIVETDCCFICGVQRGAAAFNDEHVIPNWILRKYELHNSRITLPGGTTVPYSRYTVPCCTACNTAMGETFERPLSELFSRGYAAVTQHLQESGPWLLFSWLSLIFLKTHLKDRTLQLNPDRRVQAGPIGDLVEWPEMHHIHCIARAFYSGANLLPAALGSVILMPAKTGMPLGDFDYGDYFPGRALLLRLGEVALLCVLNDSCATVTLLDDVMRRIEGPLSSLQCRELLARASYANTCIENRPWFHTSIDPSGETLTISAEIAEAIETREAVASEFGHILYSVLSSAIPQIPFANPTETAEHIRQGRWSFLFDGNGQFQANAV
jgi:hypothetical protein